MKERKVIYRKGGKYWVEEECSTEILFENNLFRIGEEKMTRNEVEIIYLRKKIYKKDGKYWQEEEGITEIPFKDGKFTIGEEILERDDVKIGLLKRKVFLEKGKYFSDEEHLSEVQYNGEDFVFSSDENFVESSEDLEMCSTEIHVVIDLYDHEKEVKKMKKQKFGLWGLGVFTVMWMTLFILTLFNSSKTVVEESVVWTPIETQMSELEKISSENPESPMLVGYMEDTGDRTWFFYFDGKRIAEGDSSGQYNSEYSPLRKKIYILWNGEEREFNFPELKKEEAKYTLWPSSLE